MQGKMRRMAVRAVTRTSKIIVLTILATFPSAGILSGPTTRAGGFQDAIGSKNPVSPTQMEKQKSPAQLAAPVEHEGHQTSEPPPQQTRLLGPPLTLADLQADAARLGEIGFQLRLA